MACCGNCFCCQCCCREGETRTPEELTILGEIGDEEDEILPRKDYESLDYDRCISEPYVEIVEGMDNKKAKKYEAVRWLMMFAIGVTVGLVGALWVPRSFFAQPNLLQMTSHSCLHVSLRWVCLWISLFASSAKSSLLWSVIVSFNILCTSAEVMINRSFHENNGYSKVCDVLSVRVAASRDKVV
ncbi:chloride transport protein 6-like isoform X1 [Anarrhichthys ocellatus]|uniref:chloride transport protein 6-like isoform X1 n=1 Tax=Anarrhichthys ocellatus TaxID=433405 RepID=UPI0012EDCCB6|nr:chloride transport protein 6-like isoform X1 [Anarrhichthys ocellatus]